MDLSKGARLGPYEIQGLVGKGGMGEVYRAVDTRLGRPVAIKVLSEQDPQRQERFHREAKTVSSLNHPHICTLYDVGEEGGTQFLVMEFLEGETLAERIRKGLLPFNQALSFATQTAEALEKAHRQGVVHRDLKPGNIMITKSGVKLLDFGLAKLKAPATPVSQASDLPTQDAAAPLTQEGTIMGTLQYMAPEQLEGTEADARTDIFAFGAILYEMVTGKKAFDGKSQASLIGAIMNSEPKPIPEAEVTVPAAFEHVVKTCLAKDPDNRWQSAGDVRRELLWITETSNPVAGAHVPTSSRQTSRRRAAIGVAAGIVASGLFTAAVMWAVLRSAPNEPRTVQRFAITPATLLLRSAGSLLGLSRDGQTLAYTGFPEGRGRQLYRHSMDQWEDTAIPGTDWGAATTAGQSSPSFFSPDGQWVAFFDPGGLKKVRLSGGPAVTVAEKFFFRGGSWGADDLIVLGAGRPGLFRVSANGGTPSPILKPGPDEGDFAFPQILPGNEAVLFTVVTTRLTGHLETVSLKTGERRKLLDGMAGQVVPSGHLVFFRSGSLWAVRFDLGRLTTVGDPIPVVERVRSELEGAFQFAIADNGTLAYLPDPGSASDRTLVWVDLKGQEQSTKAPAAAYTWARVSPDGTHAAVQIGDGENAEIGVVDLERGVLNALTNRPDLDGYPLWTPDGSRIVFSSDRNGTLGLYSTTRDGTGPVELLTAFTNTLSVQPHSWSPDGKQLVFFYIPEGRVDIGLLHLDGERKWEPLLNAPIVEQTPALSPDGQWIAYSSNESGREEIYIQRFPELGQKQQISTGGGLDPMWAPDGTTLYYHTSPPTKMMMAPIRTKPTVTVGASLVVFDRQYYRPVPGTRTHSISKDGSRLLMIKASKPSNAADRIHIVVHWFDELRRLLP